MLLVMMHGHKTNINMTICNQLKVSFLQRSVAQCVLLLCLVVSQLKGSDRSKPVTVCLSSVDNELELSITCPQQKVDVTELIAASNCRRSSDFFFFFFSFRYVFP